MAVGQVVREGQGPVGVLPQRPVEPPVEDALNWRRVGDPAGRVGKEGGGDRIGGQHLAPGRRRQAQRTDVPARRTLGPGQRSGPLGPRRDADRGSGDQRGSAAEVPHGDLQARLQRRRPTVLDHRAPHRVLAGDPDVSEVAALQIRPHVAHPLRVHAEAPRHAAALGAVARARHEVRRVDAGLEGRRDEPAQARVDPERRLGRHGGRMRLGRGQGQPVRARREPTGDGARAFGVAPLAHARGGQVEIEAPGGLAIVHAPVPRAPVRPLDDGGADRRALEAHDAFGAASRGARRIACDALRPGWHEAQPPAGDGCAARHAALGALEHDLALRRVDLPGRIGAQVGLDPLEEADDAVLGGEDVHERPIDGARRQGRDAQGKPHECEGIHQR